MDEQYQVSTQNLNENTVITDSDRNFHAHSNNSIWIAATIAEDIHSLANNRHQIASQWFRERSRQAQLSFNVAVGLAGATTILSLTFAVSVCMNKISEATAAAGLGLTSGAVSAYCFKLSDDANKRLDAAAKELLEE
ncbi:MAG: hypothetical protein KME64_17460 [Scytonematopsis contorta HA4267-MV1]|jgi:hypothetical protein|nr:hypothetical protein [Scytonematopsis contorta HA4267-MV1]